MRLHPTYEKFIWVKKEKYGLSAVYYYITATIQAFCVCVWQTEGQLDVQKYQVRYFIILKSTKYLKGMTTTLWLIVFHIWNIKI